MSRYMVTNSVKRYFDAVLTSVHYLAMYEYLNYYRLLAWIGWSAVPVTTRRRIRREKPHGTLLANFGLHTVAKNGKTTRTLVHSKILTSTSSAMSDSVGKDRWWITVPPSYNSKYLAIVKDNGNIFILFTTKLPGYNECWLQILFKILRSL